MEKIEEKEPVVFEIEGQKLFAVMHLPLHHHHLLPGVLMCHGLAGNKTGRYRLYVHLAKELARLGIASLRVDFRGCGDSDGEFSDATVSGFLKDAHISLQYLLKHPQIDSARVGIFGRSFGAAIALMAANQNNKVKSLALWSPLYDTMQWANQWKLYHDSNTPNQVREQMLRVDGQTGNYEFFNEFFKINLEQQLDELQHVPLLHIHGIKDNIIDIHHADLYEEKRKSAKAPSKFIRFAEADHDFFHRVDQLKAIEETANWFHKTL